MLRRGYAVLGRVRWCSRGEIVCKPEWEGDKGVEGERTMNWKFTVSSAQVPFVEGKPRRLFTSIVCQALH